MEKNKNVVILCSSGAKRENLDLEHDERSQQTFHRDVDRLRYNDFCNRNDEREENLTKNAKIIMQEEYTSCGCCGGFHGGDWLNPDISCGGF